MMIRHVVAIGLLLASSIATAQTGQTGQTEGINSGYVAPSMRVEEWVQRFEVEGREVFDLRNDIVDALELNLGQSIADVGAGTGLFVPLLARAVGSHGTVHAIDIAPKFIEHISKRAAAAGLQQVKAVLGTERSIELPPESVDVIFTSDAYHHFVHYEDMLASMRRALKPGGTLIVLEFDIDSKRLSKDMIEHVGGTKQKFRRQIEAAGFKFDEDLTLRAMKSSFMYRFSKSGPNS